MFLYKLPEHLNSSVEPGGWDRSGFGYWNGGYWINIASGVLVRTASKRGKRGSSFAHIWAKPQCCGNDSRIQDCKAVAIMLNHATKSMPASSYHLNCGQSMSTPLRVAPAAASDEAAAAGKGKARIPTRVLPIHFRWFGGCD